MIILSGTVGEHHATILSHRLSVKNSIESDNAVLCEMTSALFDAGVRVHTLRDVTRGGLATILKELAVSSKKRFEIQQEKLPVSPQVADFCAILGLDPLYMGNEGKMVAIVPAEDADKALSAIRNSRYGEGAVIIGSVKEPADEADTGRLALLTEIGGTRILEVLHGEGLPRIC